MPRESWECGGGWGREGLPQPSAMMTGSRLRWLCLSAAGEPGASTGCWELLEAALLSSLTRVSVAGPDTLRVARAHFCFNSTAVQFHNVFMLVAQGPFTENCNRCSLPQEVVSCFF